MKNVNLIASNILNFAEFKTIHWVMFIATILVFISIVVAVVKYAKKKHAESKLYSYQKQQLHEKEKEYTYQKQQKKAKEKVYSYQKQQAREKDKTYSYQKKK